MEPLFKYPREWLLFKVPILGNPLQSQESFCKANNPLSNLGRRKCGSSNIRCVCKAGKCQRTICSGALARWPGETRAEKAARGAEAQPWVWHAGKATSFLMNFLSCFKGFQSFAHFGVSASAWRTCEALGRVGCCCLPPRPSPPERSSPIPSPPVRLQSQASLPALPLNRACDWVQGVGRCPDFHLGYFPL